MFSTLNDLKYDFKSWFVSSMYINQTLIHKHYITNPDGITICTTFLNTSDLSVGNVDFDIPTPTTDMYLKFPISNGEFQSTHEIISISTNYTISNSDTDDSDITLSQSVNFMTLIMRFTSTRRKGTSPIQRNQLYSLLIGSTTSICWICSLLTQLSATASFPNPKPT